MAEDKEKKPVSVDPTVGKLLDKAAADGCETAFDRVATGQKNRCTFGADGLCCRICSMGPCRISKKAPQGVCGATAETIAARNFARMVAGGAAAHSDHGRAVAEVFHLAMEGKIPGYEIKDRQKLYAVAMDYGIDIGDKSDEEIGKELAEAALHEFGNQEGEIKGPGRAPLKRQELWRKLGVMPRGVDREIVEIMHRTHMGVDMHYENIIKQCSRAAIGDGWGGSMIATDLQDIIFGTPVPIASEMNLGCLKEDHVNLIVHGHEPLLSEMIVVAAQQEDMVKKAKDAGAKGINVAGMCCTANEILMRHGLPIAGNFLQQELAIITGALDGMIVDVQCIMQSLSDVSKCYHTKLITTNYRAKIPGATHIQFEEDDALKSAREIVEATIENYKNRDPKKVAIPDEKCEVVAGFSHETISYLLGGLFRASYKPLNDNIINGRIRGIGGVVGCNNARTTHDEGHLTIIKELLKHDVIVLTTGCAAMACGKAGLLTNEAKQFCGDGLAEVIETVGIPPVIHMGSCVDNSRILLAAAAVVKEGGLGDDISDLPAAGSAPEWMSEKAISIGHYFVASGVYTVFGTTFPIMGSEILKKHLFEELEDQLGGMWDFEPDPVKHAQKMIAHIDKKRKALGIDKARERVLYDMSMRREME